MARRRSGSNGSQRVAWRTEQSLWIIAVGTLALIVSLTWGLSKLDSLILIGGAMIVTGGIIFTFMEMGRLGSQHGVQIAEKNVGGANRLENYVRMGTIVQPPIPESTEAVPHHEYYPESPGQDQGQLTSHWPSSTPFLASLIRAFQRHRK